MLKQIKDIAITKTEAEEDDFLVMQNPNTGETFNIIKAHLLAGLSTGEPEYFNRLVFLSHFNGENNSTNIQDIKGSIITRYGDAKISTVRSKWGNGSLLLDGTGDYLTFPYASNADICGGDDFKLEFWYYPLSVTGFRTLAAQWRQVTGGGGFLLASSGTSVFFYFGAFSESNTLLSGGTLAINTWYHIAVTKIATKFTLWINGAAVSTASSSASKILTSVNYSIGNYYNNGGTLGALNASDCYGNFNEFRIIKPTAFTIVVPIEPFPDN